MLLSLLGGLALAEPGTEFVIVLDNSCSMVEPHTEDEQLLPAADPDRRAVLGAQIVSGLTLDSTDRVTVLGFPVREGGDLLELHAPDAVRDIPPSTGTWFEPPLSRANTLLQQSPKQDRMLLVLSDGAPGDLQAPEDGRRLLGLDGNAPFDTLVLGLFADERPEAEAFLTALARRPEDYHRVTDGAEVVSQFTRGYAHSLGSLALTGTLSPGGSETFEVGRYVTEVLAVTTTVERSGPYRAGLEQDGRQVPVQAAGDNGCSWQTRRNPTYCAAPRMHYQVWRTSHDPTSASRVTLDLPEAGGDVAYGLILRYDLQAAVEDVPPGRLDEPSPVRARLLWNGETFDDEAFFDRDGFQVRARVGEQSVPLEHVGDGLFEGSYTPRTSRPQPVEVVFSNTWMRKAARGRITVETPPPLALSGPEQLDFGHWRGGRWTTTSCAPLTVRGNHRFDPASVRFAFDGLPEGLTLDLEPDETGWTVCARATGCCGDLHHTELSALRVLASDHDASEAELRVPVRFQVDPTGFFRCWGPWICALLTLAVLFWFVYGWIRPHDFDEDLTVRIAGSERTLSRSAALVLREQPRGRRGFYRNARVALTASGDFVARTRQAAFWVEATGPGDTRIHLQGPLEVKDRRTKQWRPVTTEEAADGIRTNIVYRLGETCFRFQ